jgi:two-component system, LuxR family, response regulator FixJ
MSTATVYLIDPDIDVQNAVRNVLEPTGLAVETFCTAQDFLEAYVPARPGCLLVETQLPGMSGLELQDRLAQTATPPAIIVIAWHGDVATAVRAMRAGAIDVLEKPLHPQLLLPCVQRALEQDEQSRQIRAVRVAVRERRARLTRREYEVMVRVVAGLPNKGIATCLGVTRKAVEAYRARAMHKMQASSLAEFVRLSVVLDHGSPSICLEMHERICAATNAGRTPEELALATASAAPAGASRQAERADLNFPSPIVVDSVYSNSGCPVISDGIGKPSSASAVGATSANRPPVRNLAP